MNTREIAEEYRLTHWAGVMKERAASGQNVREFCKSAGIREHIYYYWQRKLRETASQELATVNTQEITAPSGWLMCASEEAAKTTPGSISIAVGAYKVIVEVDADLELLKKVVRALAEQC